jgi:capsular polysaccharide biosynthesis protein
MEEMQKEEGLSLLEILRILFHQLKLLILVVIIGAASGAFVGFGRYANVKNYGTSIEFYVNPEKPKEVGASSNSAANAVGSQYGVYGAYGRHVMDAIVKLLESESFAEQLMLNGAPLPCVTEAQADHEINYYPNVNAQVEYENAQAALAKAEAAWATAKTFDEPRAIALENLENNWTSAGQLGSFSLVAYNKLLNAGEAPQYLIDSYAAFKEIDNSRHNALIIAEEEQNKASDVVEIFLEKWRATDKYKDNLKLYKESVSYSYLGDDEDIEDANNLARSFIYVDINVSNNEEFANILLEHIKVVVPDYIEKNMIVPTDYEGTSCTRITRTNDIRHLNANLARNQAIKYGFLFAAAAGVIAAVVVIIIDVQDKRLRDYEIVSRKLNIPVLGIVPTIEEMNQAVELKKQELRKQRKGGL